MVTFTDKQWAVIAPLLPKQNMEKGGRPRAEYKKTLEGILWILKSGAQWGELPARYGSYATCWRRLKAWEEDGTWEHIWQRLLAVLSKQDKLMLSVGMVDGTFSPAKKGGAWLVRRKKAKAPN